jgi:hypothetical protein
MVDVVAANGFIAVFVCVLPAQALAHAPALVHQVPNAMPRWAMSVPNGNGRCNILPHPRRIPIFYAKQTSCRRWHRALLANWIFCASFCVSVRLRPFSVVPQL